MGEVDGTNLYGVYMVFLGTVLLSYLAFVHGDPLSTEPLSKTRPERTPIFGTAASAVSIAVGWLLILGYGEKITAHFE